MIADKKNTGSNNRNAIRIFLTLIIVYAFFTNRYLTTNDASRFSLTAALVDTGSPEITDILQRVISPGWRIKDFAKIGDKVYSEKAPLGSFLAMPVYFAASRMGFSFGWVVFFTSLFTSGLCTALTGVLIYKVVLLWVRDERRAILLALAYGLGTMALFYGTVFFSHSITALCCFASFYCLTLLQIERDKPAIAAAGGLLAGMAFMSDYFAAISVVCLLGYAVMGRRRLLHIALGFCVPVALLLLYNDWVFGSVWPLSYSYSYLYSQLHASGLYGLTFPSFEQLVHLKEILFSRWGFFFANLMVLFVIVGLPRFMVFRRQAAMLAVMALGYLYLNACQSWLDAYSARFFLPLLPFLMLPLMHLDFGNRWLRNTFLLILGFSVAINFVGVDSHLREFMLEPCEHGMQNLAGSLLAPLGHRLGYWNFLFLLLPIAPIWLIPTGRKETAPHSGGEKDDE